MDVELVNRLAQVKAKEKHLRSCIADVIERPEFKDIEFNNLNLGHFINRVIAKTHFEFPDPLIQQAIRSELLNCWIKGQRLKDKFVRIPSNERLYLEEQILFRIAESLKYELSKKDNPR